MRVENGTLTVSELDRVPLPGGIVWDSWLGLHRLQSSLMDSSQFARIVPGSQRSNGPE
jgi:hypothetical protein